MSTLTPEERTRINGLVGRSFFDDDGRRFDVKAVAPGDQLGREVTGKVVTPESANLSRAHPFATDMKTFDATWKPPKPFVAVLNQPLGDAGTPPPTTPAT